MTTDAVPPVGGNQNSLTVGPRGPVVFEDFLVFEKMAQFNRERIPERVVHAKGSAAHGHFACTNPDMAKYTTAKLFSKAVKSTPAFLRFSTVGGEKGSADTERILVASPSSSIPKKATGTWSATIRPSFSSKLH